MSKNYYLNIHHRSIGIEPDESNNSIITSSSPGHFFISLENDNDHVYFGKYPSTNKPKDYLYSKDRVRSNSKERRDVDNIRLVQDKQEQEYLSTKSIVLTEAQYNSALKYAQERKVSENNQHFYSIGISDCTDFVQEVYNAAGLPLYFTSVYNKSDLEQLNTLAATKVLLKYKSLDNFVSYFSNITNYTKDGLAKTLNIPVSAITYLYTDPDTALLHFKVSVDDVLDNLVIKKESSGSIQNNNIVSSTECNQIEDVATLELQKYYNQKIKKDLKERGITDPDLLQRLDESDTKIDDITPTISTMMKAVQNKIRYDVEQCCDEQEKPLNKLRKFGFSEQEILSDSAKTNYIMTNYNGFNLLYNELKSRFGIKLNFADIPDNKDKTALILEYIDSVIEFYDNDLISTLNDLPNDINFLKHILQYEVGVVFMKENGVIDSLEDLMKKVPNMDDLSSFEVMANKSIELLEEKKQYEKSLSIKWLVMYSTIPPEDQNNIEKVLEAVKNKGDQQLIEFFYANRSHLESELIGDTDFDIV